MYLNCKVYQQSMIEMLKQQLCSMVAQTSCSYALPTEVRLNPWLFILLIMLSPKCVSMTVCRELLLCPLGTVMLWSSCCVFGVESWHFLYLPWHWLLTADSGSVYLVFLQFLYYVLVVCFSDHYSLMLSPPLVLHILFQQCVTDQGLGDECYPLGCACFLT